MPDRIESELMSIDHESSRMAHEVLLDASRRDGFQGRANALLRRLDELESEANAVPGGPNIVSECRLDLWYVLRPSPGVSLRLGHAMRKRELIAASKGA